MKTTILAMILLTSTVAFAGIHDDCKVGTNVENRGFAIGYTGSVIDVKSDKTADGGWAEYDDYEMKKKALATN